MAKRKKRVVRKSVSNPANVDQDNDGLLWVQEVQVRTRSERQPMAPLSRWKKRIGVKPKKCEAIDMSQHQAEADLDQHSLDSGDDEFLKGGGDTTDDADTPSPQSRMIRSASLLSPSSVASSFKQRGGEDGDDYDSDDSDESSHRQFTVKRNKTRLSLRDQMFLTDVDEYSYRPSTLFVKYVNWTFRRGFWVVFLSFLLVFFAINLLFAGLMQWAGELDPECIVVAGEEFGTNPHTKFADAFALSWTTFTTVGYGMIYTATGSDIETQTDNHQCTFIVFLSTAESFIGLLYAGMCAAILFGKVGRIQSHAQVKFSNSICVQIGMPRYISMAPSPDEDEEEDVEKTPKSSKKRSVTIEKPIEDAVTPLQSGKGRKHMSLMPQKRKEPQSVQSTLKAVCPFPVITFQVVNKLCNEHGGEIMDANMRVVASDRGEAGSASVVASYTKVQLAEFDHPFFNRVWHGRHTLDAHSPLLSRLAKIMIHQNGNTWPEEWNNPKSVRNALRFSDMIVTLTGISNVSAATVHAYKRYKYGDLLVGYEFAPVLYKHPDTQRLKVDMRLIHDVVGQTNGRAENVDQDDDSRSSFASIRLEEKDTERH